MSSSPSSLLRDAIVAGDVATVESMLQQNPTLANALVGDNPRTMLHYATDWPGHFPNVAKTIQLLIAAGGDVNAGADHPENDAVSETPLHWAASSNDVAAAQVLLDAGAHVNALGGIFDGCTAFEEAIIFQNFEAARLLLAYGASNYLAGAAALGMTDEIDSYFNSDGSLNRQVGRLANWHELPPAQRLLDRGFQFACRSGHLAIAQNLLDRGADPRAISPGNDDALEMATTNEHPRVVEWLQQVLAG